MPQQRLARAGLYLQSAFYFVGGVLHLFRPSLYLAIMPDHYSHPGAWVVATGAAEIAGAIGLLLPATRRAAAIGIMLMLLGYFDVHIFMLQHARDRFAGIPHWALIVRLSLQLVLIAWAAAYARRSR